MRAWLARKLRSGFSLVEVMVAIAILAVLLLISISFVVANSRDVIQNDDRAFAVQKATSMLAELRGLAEKTTTVDASTLDAFDDGAATNLLLTTDPTVTDPKHELSSNVWLGTRWRYARRVTIRKFPNLNSRDVRIAQVRVFLTDTVKNDAVVLADVASVINTVADAFPPSQVYDTYILAIENVPGWWVYMSYIRPFVENALDDLESRQPGLVFRRHWITKAGFGRDRQYRPYFNNTVDTVQPINWVYFYPGLLPAGSATDRYYVPDQVRARINIDGATANDYNAGTNPYPYALADQYNHCMRAPDEDALYRLRTADQAARGVPVDEPTYRWLLDDMIANPDNYRNAIFINVHGELVPFPPLRNYSDPAKDPAGRPNLRVVTHPEKLRLDPTVATDDLKLRVYAYYEDATAPGLDYIDTPVSVFFPGKDLVTGGYVTVQGIKGGTDRDPQDGTLDPYGAPSLPNAPGAGVTANKMYYQIVPYPGPGPTPGTLVLLYNTPTRCPYINVGSPAPLTGLNSTRRLYGNDYIPCTCEAANDFTTGLAAAGDKPKNTARWVITVAKAGLDLQFGGGNSQVTVETRIGNNLSTGAMWPVANQPANLSRTYAWRCTTATYCSLKGVPFSERFQFQGDPRHCPYKDVKVIPIPAPPAAVTYNGFNWYFDNFNDTAGGNQAAMWPGFDTAKIRNTLGVDYDGWHGGGTNGTAVDSCEVDVPRYFSLLRNALCETNSIYTTLTGFSYYYMGQGNEIGYDSANGFATSIPVNSKPFTGVTGTRNEDSITDAQTGGVKLIRENVSPYWWSKPWLGELYPDSAAAQWTASGNLPTGVGAGNFVRIRRQDIRVSGVAPLAKANSLPLGTTFSDHRTVRRLNSRGCTSFFNIGSTVATFRHNYRDTTTGNQDVGGTQLDSTYNFPVPLSTLISRPFRLDYNLGANVGDEFNIAEYSSNRCSAANLLTYFNHQDGTPPWLGSAIIRHQNAPPPGVSPAPTPNCAFQSVNGIDRTVQTGSAFIATYASLTLIHTFLRSGLTGTPSRVRQLPQLVIDYPNDTTELHQPLSIAVQWSTNWKRWDGRDYTPDFSSPVPLPTPFKEVDTGLRYALLYSRDNGKTWLHMKNDSTATPGVPNQLLWSADVNVDTAESYSWDVSDGARFPEASYLIRVEAYWASRLIHYSFHQQKIFIQR